MLAVEGVLLKNSILFIFKGLCITDAVGIQLASNVNLPELYYVQKHSCYICLAEIVGFR